MLNLIHTRPKLVVAISEHDRLGLVLEAAPYVTLPQRFVDAVFVQFRHWCATRHRPAQG